MRGTRLRCSVVSLSFFFSFFFLARGSNGAINRLKVLCLNKFNIIRGVKKYNVSRKEHPHNIILRVSQRTVVARVTQILLTWHYRCVPENKNNEISVTARVPDTTCNTCELSCGKAKKKKNGWRQLVLCVYTTVGGNWRSRGSRKTNFVVFVRRESSLLLHSDRLITFS